jgi:site-specific DNA-methyltransferase (adenine-specific)
MPQRRIAKPPAWSACCFSNEEEATKPYYEHAGITIYHGDCRDFCLHTDCVITDPVWPNCPAGLLAGAENPWLLFQEWCQTQSDKGKRATFILRHDCDPRFLGPIELPFARTSILPYVMSGYIGRWLGGDELAYSFGEPIKRQTGQIVIPGRAPSVQPRERPPNGHPCSRSLRHMEFIVRWWSEKEEVVLDPFCGSGTTLLACANQGRKGIGIGDRGAILRDRGRAAAPRSIRFPLGLRDRQTATNDVAD